MPRTPAKARTATRPPAREEFRAPLLLLVILTALRIIYLEYTPLNLYTDEAQYWLWAQSLDAGYFSKPPLIAWLVRAATNVCGNGETCVRLASPLLHMLTALVVGAIGQEIGGRRVAFWSAIGYATLPGVFYSATLITTDVPLLLFWAVMVLALIRLLGTRAWSWAALAGVAAGFGFLSKYAMLFALPGVAILLAWSPAARSAAMLTRLGAAGLIAAAIALPNVVWNVTHDFLTVRHTVGLIEPSPFDALSPLQFLAAQVAIFGIVLSGALALRLAEWRRLPGDDRERLLLALSLPAVLAVLVLSLVAPVDANWAAVAYVPLAPLVVAWLLRGERTRWLVASVALNCALALTGAALVAGDTLWRRGGGCGFEALDRHLGWERIGPEVARRLQASPGMQLLSDDREVLAPLVYYALLEPGQFAKWHPSGPPDDHYALTAPVLAYPGATWLLASTRGQPSDILARFETANPAGRLTVPLSVCRARVVTFYELEGFRGY